MELKLKTKFLSGTKFRKKNLNIIQSFKNGTEFKIQN